jgi:hypothetical protein
MSKGLVLLAATSALALAAFGAATAGRSSGRAACPVSPLHEVSPAFGLALGRGPVYAIGAFRNSTFVFEYPPPPSSPFAGTGWGVTKTLWVAPRSYRGPIVISGRQIDGPHQVRFSLGYGKLADRLAFKAGSSIATSRGGERWRQFPSLTALQAAGCYAFTVEGSTFTRRIVFRARKVRP